MRLIARLLNFFYRRLYHNLAFAYDAVAALVSFGQWVEWTKATLPFIKGTRILELGHGPGHLQRLLLETRSPKSSRSTPVGPDFGQSRETLPSAVFGLDESSQMGRLARRRLVRAGHAHPNLTRGLGQSLPFRDAAFDSIVATFPADYIFAAQTAAEAWRTLKNGGRLIVLPVAWPKNRFLTWLYRVTHEAPSEALNVVKAKIGQPFARVGFEVKVEVLEVKSSVLLIILAQKLAEG